MIKTLAMTLILAITTTAAVASIPGRGGDIDTSLQVSNTAAKADRLDASNKSDRLPVANSGKFELSLLMTGPVRIAGAY